MRARVSGSAGTRGTRPPSRSASAMISAQPVSGCSSSNSTTGTLSAPVHAFSSGVTRRERTASAGICLTWNRPFAASVHGLGSADATTIRRPRAARAVSMSTYVSRSMGAKTSARDAAELCAVTECH